MEVRDVDGNWELMGYGRDGKVQWMVRDGWFQGDGCVREVGIVSA